MPEYALTGIAALAVSVEVVPMVEQTNVVEGAIGEFEILGYGSQCLHLQQTVGSIEQADIGRGGDGDEPPLAADGEGVAFHSLLLGDGQVDSPAVPSVGEFLDGDVGGGGTFGMQCDRSLVASCLVQPKV